LEEKVSEKKSGSNAGTEIISEADLKISLSDLGQYLISPGNVFIKLKSGKNLKLCRAGHPIDASMIEKYSARAESIVIERVTDYLNVIRLEELFLRLRNETDFNKVPWWRNMLLAWFKKVYWDGAASGSMLDLISVGEKVFYNLPEDIERSMKGNAFDLFTRGSLMGTMGATLCLAMGYMDFTFLRDFYHVCMLLDYKIHSNISFTLKEALIKSSEDFSRGIAHLESMKLDHEVKILKGHVDNKKQPEWSKILQTKSIANLALRHHERMNKTGYPNGLSEDDLSDAEVILIFLDSLFPPGEIEFTKNDGKGFLKKAFQKLENAEAVMPVRLQNMLPHIFSSLPDDEILEKMVG